MKSSLPVGTDLIGLPDTFFLSEFGTSYRVILAASGRMLSNFSCWLELCQIGHLPDLRDL